MKQAERTVRDLLALADIEIDGPDPWDIKVNDQQFYARVLSNAALGLGESYMDGWWDCERLDTLIHKLLRSGIEEKVKPIKLIVPILAAKLFNRQKVSRAYQVAEKHYDTSNDMFKLMLDERMVYTCAYWKDATDLEAAQEAKLDLVCRKIGLQNGMRVLDIGCGWGSFAKFAAQKYGASVVGVSVSKEQTELARKMCQGLDVDLRLEDYRSIDEKFDRVVSIGMFEAVGPKNFRTFMKVADRCLNDDGIFLLHTIGTNTIATATDPWSEKYIFPNGALPTALQLTKATDGIFQIEDWHNLNANYTRTLLAWMDRFDLNWKKIEALGFNDRFYRMWRYFLLTAAGTFTARRSHLWQVVYSKNGIEGGYEAIR